MNEIWLVVFFLVLNRKCGCMVRNNAMRRVYDHETIKGRSAQKVKRSDRVSDLICNDHPRERLKEPLELVSVRLVIHERLSFKRIFDVINSLHS
jgi:hypothetical protein